MTVTDVAATDKVGSCCKKWKLAEIVFSTMFCTYSDRYPSFEDGKTLKSIIMDQSVTEFKGLREASDGLHDL